MPYTEINGFLHKVDRTISRLDVGIVDEVLDRDSLVSVGPDLDEQGVILHIVPHP